MSPPATFPRVPPACVQTPRSTGTCLVMERESPLLPWQQKLLFVWVFFASESILFVLTCSRSLRLWNDISEFTPAGLKL